MGKGLVTDTSLAAIADSIRAKNGESTKYKPSDMATAIDNLPSGGGAPGNSTTFNIPYNGTISDQPATGDFVCVGSEATTKTNQPNGQYDWRAFQEEWGQDSFIASAGGYDYVFHTATSSPYGVSNTGFLSGSRVNPYQGARMSFSEKLVWLSDSQVSRATNLTLPYNINYGCPLSATKRLLFHKNGGNLYITAMSIDNNWTISTGETTLIDACYTYIRAKRLSDNTALIIYRPSNSSTSVFGIIVSISDNDVTIGTKVELCDLSTGWSNVNAAKLSESSFLLLVPNNVSSSRTAPYSASICNVSGTTITVGTAYAIGSRNGRGSILAIAKDASRVFVTSRESTVGTPCILDNLSIESGIVSKAQDFTLNTEYATLYGFSNTLITVYGSYRNRFDIDSSTGMLTPMGALSGLTISSANISASVDVGVNMNLTTIHSFEIDGTTQYCLVGGSRVFSFPTNRSCCSAARVGGRQIISWQRNNTIQCRLCNNILQKLSDVSISSGVSSSQYSKHVLVPISDDKVGLIFSSSTDYICARILTVENDTISYGDVFTCPDTTTSSSSFDTAFEIGEGKAMVSKSTKDWLVSFTSSSVTFSQPQTRDSGYIYPRMIGAYKNYVVVDSHNSGSSSKLVFYTINGNELSPVLTSSTISSAPGGVVIDDNKVLVVSTSSRGYTITSYVVVDNTLDTFKIQGISTKYPLAISDITLNWYVRWNRKTYLPTSKGLVAFGDIEVYKKTDTITTGANGIMKVPAQASGQNAEVYMLDIG